MCIDTDLFGDVIVRNSEIDFWLDTTANLQGRAQSQREHYAKMYDVANKIKLSKLDGSFYKLIERVENDQPSAISLYATVYKTDPLDVKKPACPDWFHQCDNVKCPVYKKRLAHEKAAARYAKDKAISRFV